MIPKYIDIICIAKQPITVLDFMFQGGKLPLEPGEVVRIKTEVYSRITRRHQNNIQRLDKYLEANPVIEEEVEDPVIDDEGKEEVPPSEEEVEEESEAPVVINLGGGKKKK